MRFLGIPPPAIPPRPPIFAWRHIVKHVGAICTIVERPLTAIKNDEETPVPHAGSMGSSTEAKQPSVDSSADAKQPSVEDVAMCKNRPLWEYHGNA